METISPALAHAHFLLRNHVIERLDAAEFFGQLDDWTEDQMDLAHKVIDDLVTVIRTLLVCHIDDETGTCRKCARPWPCDVFQMLHTVVKNPEHEFDRIVEGCWAESLS